MILGRNNSELETIKLNKIMKVITPVGGNLDVL